MSYVVPDRTVVPTWGHVDTVVGRVLSVCSPVGVERHCVLTRRSWTSLYVLTTYGCSRCCWQPMGAAPSKEG